MQVKKLLFVTLLVTGPVFAQMPQAPKEALDGVDPVALLSSGKEVIGKTEFKVTRGKFDYLFASAENKAAFEKAPETYEIQLSGACARMQGGVTGNPSDYAVVDGKIYIFGSDDCHKKFVAAPQKFLPKPAPAMPSSAAAVQAGRALLEKVVEAVGGAQPLAAVTAYTEIATQTQQRPTGQVDITTKTIRRFPADVRVERTQTGRPPNAILITDAGGWFLAPDRAYVQNPEARVIQLQEFNRQLLPLLRLRGDADVNVAAVPAETIAGTDVDRVRLKKGGLDVTLNLVKGKAQLHSMSYVGRGLDSEIGDYLVIYSDFREVSGLRLPFAENALFNGSPDSFQTRKIQGIEINPAIDAALFQAPAAGGK